MASALQIVVLGRGIKCTTVMCAMRKTIWQLIKSPNCLNPRTYYLQGDYKDAEQTPYLNVIFVIKSAQRSKI